MRDGEESVLTSNSGSGMLQSGSIEQKRVKKCKMPSYVDSICLLNLTPLGKAKLCAYPEDALQDALNALKMTRRMNINLVDPFTFVIKTAATYCKINGIAPNYAFVERYIAQEGISKGMPSLKPKSANPLRKASMHEDKPLSQRTWKRDYNLPSPADFNPKKLADYFTTEAWLKLQRMGLATDLHQFLMAAISDAERRESNKQIIVK